MAELHFGRDTSGRMTLAIFTLAGDTLARVTLWPIFLASFGVAKGEYKFHGDYGKNLKKYAFFFLKNDYFFQIFMYSV